jgi:hypothetical protein
LLDAAYPADTAIEIILDNHSAHVSRETTAWLAAQPTGRFTFTFTPTHGSWLNLIASKHELKERLMAFIEDLNREPILHIWRYKVGDAV